MEQVWKVILTVPERHLYLEAIHFLIRMYLEVSYSLLIHLRVELITAL